MLGTVHHRYYRKEQDKGITLHSLSHHPTSVKEECVKNFYKTAERTSSGPSELTHSLNLVDELLLKNGYKDPRTTAMSNSRNKKRKKRKNQSNINTLPLVLPFISDHISNKIRNYIASNKLPIKVIFTPGTKLEKLFCKSRPLDTKMCDLGNQNKCAICPNLVGSKCATKDAIYLVVCDLCAKSYLGETERSLHARFMEHRRAANNPPSDPENAIGQHYLTDHLGQQALLSYRLLEVQSISVRRKIVEALKIQKLKPELNDKMELKYLCKYVIN